ncbi:MAG: hypothetical protein K2J90_09740 [Lachnospiraceae bacterium]|nr:hypothetical protein [Lachnospiraceae bacterium]
MAMQISGNYDHSGINYAERVKEKEAAERAEKAKETGKQRQKALAVSEPWDEYISSEKSGKEPTGLYRIGQDDNGNRKIFFDDPNMDDRATAKENDDRSKGGTDGKEPKVSGNHPGKLVDRCVANTDKVDREIKKLKEKKQQLEKQIQSASGGEMSSGYPAMPFGDKDERKIQNLEKQLVQVENELRQKDNDIYRRSHSVFSRTK